MAVPTFTDDVVFPTDPVASYVGQAGTPGPGVYFRLNDALASPTAADVSGFGNTGTVNGTVTFQQAGYIANNKAALFDGSTGYITAAASATFTPTLQLSVVGWFSFTGTPGAALGGTAYTIFECNQFTLYLTTVSGAVVINYQPTDAFSATASFAFIGAPVTAATTYQFALTDDGQHMLLYLNGVLVTQLNRSSQSLNGGFNPGTSGTLYMGRNSAGATDFYKGVFDEMMIVPDVVMSAPQIASLYLSAGIVPTAQLVYTTLTNRPRQMSVQRGKQHELDTTQAGNATALLLNLDRALDPTNTLSPYYPNVKPMRRLRRRATINGVVYPVFAGFVERWPQQRVGPNYADVPMQAVDGFEALSLTQITGTFPQETTGARITRVLNLVFWPVADRNIATGDSLAQAVTLTTGTSALSHIQDMEKTERGWFYMASDGKATFLNRHATLPQSQASQASFSDQPQAGSVYPYTDIVTSYDRDRIWNDWTDTPPGFGGSAHAEDAASIQSYFRRSQSMNTFATTYADSFAGVQFALTKFKDPQLSVDQIVLRPGNDTGFWQTVLARELGDRITVTGSPPGGGTFTKDLLIAQISMNIPAAVQDTTITWNLLPAGDTVNYWLAGIPGFSEAGTTTRAVW